MRPPAQPIFCPIVSAAARARGRSTSAVAASVGLIEFDLTKDGWDSPNLKSGPFSAQHARQGLADPP